MRGPKPTRLELDTAMRSELEQLVRRHATPQQLALRARMVLACASEANNAQIAGELGVNVDTVRLWRARWRACAPASLEDFPIIERLSDAPRSGKPVCIAAEQICQILGLACEAPERAGPSNEPLERL